MASNTPNYELRKPASTDFYNVEDQNANMDKLDVALKELADGKAAITHAAQHAAGGSDPVTPGSIGAATADHTHTPASIGAAPAVHTHDDRYFTEGESLSTTTAALFGLGGGAVPNDVLGLLSRFQSGLGNEQLWEKRIKSSFSLGDSAEQTIYDTYSNSATNYVSYSDEVVIANDGIPVLENSASVSVSYDAYTNANILAGKYFKGLDGTIYLGDATGVAVRDTHTVVSTMYRVKFPGKAIINIVAPTLLGYVNSPDENAYQSDSTYTYVPLGQVGDKIRVITGSYTGTGTYGSLNPNSLIFNFVPKFVMIYARYQISQKRILLILNDYSSFFIPDLLTTTYTSGIGPTYSPTNNGTRGYAKKSEDGKTISWYNINTADYQLNDSGSYYYYIAIG